MASDSDFLSFDEDKIELIGSNSDSEDGAKAALETLLFDKKLADVSLEGKDGVQVEANRCILAARSNSFCSLLYGGTEDKASVVKVEEYTGSVVRSVVEFCYTDNFVSPNLTDPWELAQELVGLANAAISFELPRLCRLAEEASIDVIDEDSYYAISFFDVSRRQKHKELRTITDHAIEKIRKNLKSILKNPKTNFSNMDDDVMEEILEMDDLECKEIHRFALLDKWVYSNNEYRDRESQEARLKKAKLMTKHIHLDRIPPSFLSSDVRSSGLITTEELCTAYELQALVAEREKQYTPRQRSDKVYFLPKLVVASTETSLGSSDNGSIVELVASPRQMDENQWTVDFVRSCEYILQCGTMGSEQYD